MKGYAGKFLRIDLNMGEVKKERLTEEVARAFIGGYGFVAWTLYNEVPDGADPLSPENVLCLWTGPVAGTTVPVSSKYIISYKFAMVNKKLEWGAYSLRSLQTATLGFATSVRGACYLRSGSYQVDVKGQVDRYHLDRSRGKIVFDGENLYAVIDSLIICKFTRGIYKDNEELAKVIRLVTGFDMDAEEMIKAGERIHNMAKLFNIRFGASRKDDYPPPRAFEEKMYDEVNNGAVIDRAEYDEALSGYYKCRGWNEEGIPTKAKLEELGLDTTLGV